MSAQTSITEQLATEAARHVAATANEAYRSAESGASELGTLERLAAVNNATATAIREHVAVLRAQDVPWRIIGASLHLTAQGAQQRYGRTLT